MRNILSSAFVAASLVTSSLAALNNPVDPIVIKGSKFFYKTNGTQFYLKGIAYQQEYSGGGGNTPSDGSAPTSYSDPLANEAGCKRDLPYLVNLHTNALRVYAVDPTQNHDACMQLFNDAGIYVIADLSQPSLSINRDDPAWDVNLYNRYTSVVDALQGYSNVIGFFAGNEVTNNVTNTDASAFVKAAVRDTKAYISSKNYRTIGVGYATNDDADIRVDLANYFNCGSDQSEAIDFWGYNIYSWCGQNTFQGSGFADRTQQFSSYSVPAFFAEYGCNTQGTRTFQEDNSIYGPDMESVWSGGIVYMYFQEANNYGMVSVDGNSVSTMADYPNLASQLATLTPSGTVAASYTPSNSPASCPAIGASWSALADPLPPTPNAQRCQCMVQSLACVVNSNVAAKDYANLFSYVCSNDANACAGIGKNTTSGTYGAYSMCDAADQLSFVLNRYYVNQGSEASACSFSGSATIKATTTNSNGCASLTSGLGSEGTGTAPPSRASGSGSGGQSSSKSKGAAGNAFGLQHNSFASVYMTLALYVVGGVLSGAAMLLL